mmetsp:Transcript_143181/g.249832  ORF Transcript_143181/g.249832 Transcript_143181/m.249832 type:complete len:304 (-) Transcript_143181:11-922(-)
MARAVDILMYLLLVLLGLCVAVAGKEDEGTSHAVKTVEDEVELTMSLMSHDGLFRKYMLKAEKSMEWEWTNHIWPHIKHADFATVLDLGTGGGRNAKKLKRRAKRMILVDFSKTAIDHCKRRFERFKNFEYYLNDGRTLPMIRDQSVTLLYCWDSAVHFHQEVIRGYLKEIARILVPGGRGFLHHSNLGNLGSRHVIHAYRLRRNPMWRTNMTKELFVQYAKEAELVVESQNIIHWADIEDLDCISMFRKPCAGDAACEQKVRLEKEAEELSKLEGVRAQASGGAPSPSPSSRQWAFRTWLGL